MAQHTPGPFEARYVHDMGLIAIAPVGKMYPIATVGRWTDGKSVPPITEEDSANADLFLTAPDLLAALKELRWCVGNVDRASERMDAACEAADAALAKAGD